MSPEQFKRCRKWLGLSQGGVADYFGIASERTVRRWEDGEKDIPEPVVILMELCVKFPEVRDYLDMPEPPHLKDVET